MDGSCGKCRDWIVLPALSLSLRPQPPFATLPSRRWLSSPEMLDDVCERTKRFCRNFCRVRNPAFQVCWRKAGEGGAPMGKASWTHLIALPAGAPGRGRACCGATVPVRADARPPRVPRCRRAEPGGRTPATRCCPASGSFLTFGESLLRQAGVSVAGWVGAKGQLKPYPNMFRAWKRALSALRCCSPCESC